jgi:DNA processing protein
VAVVGTRDADPIGAAFARRLAREIAEADVGVLSGGALGIDAAAHRGALQGQGRTVVVLPSGLSHWYPRRHEALFREVIDKGGALVSQFPPETPPTRWTFPRRNALVATLADLVLVVQAPVNSGALDAAECARRLGRRVMAVPAAPTDRRGAGCVRLLRAGALPCASARDVLDALAAVDGPLVASADGRARTSRSRARGAHEKIAPELLASRTRTREAENTPSLDADEALVYDSLSVARRHVDEITRITGLDVARVQRSLLTLTLAGLVVDEGSGCHSRS